MHKRKPNDQICKLDSNPKRDSQTLAGRMIKTSHQELKMGSRRKPEETQLPPLGHHCGLLVVLFLLSCCCPPLAGQQQFSADQASNAISLLLKQNQASACDGEQLDIKCNDDYVIEIMAAELTVLANEHHQRAPVLTSVSLAPPSSSGNQSEREAGGRPAEQLICAPLSAGAISAANETQTICEDQEAHELAATHKPKLLSVVRKHCSLLNACTLDFRIAGANQTTEADADASTAIGNFRELTRLLNDKCASNRKLLELIYKCRPSKVKSRAACRQGRLALECPPGESNKRLAIGSAVYGFWNDDKKTHEKCLAEEERLGQAPLATSQLVNARNCSTLSSQPFNVVASECLFKQQCQLQLKPQLFRSPQADFLASTTCPQGQLEYLKVIYVCISEELLITTNSSQLQQGAGGQQRSLASSSGTSAGSRQAAGQPFSAGGVLSSSLLSSPGSQVNVTTPGANQLPISVGGGGGGGGGQQSPQLAAEPADANKSSTRSSENPNALATIDESGSAQLVQVASNVRPSSPSGQPRASSANGASRTLLPVDEDPEISQLPWNKWTLRQRLKVELFRLQGPIIGLSVITLTVFTLSALLIRACRSSRSRNSNASSSSSSKSSSSSSKSFGSSATDYTASQHSQPAGGQHTATVASQQLMSAGGLASSALQQFNYSKHHHHQHQHGKHHEHRQQPTNSCSESCFSLDDYHCQQQQQHQMQRPPPLQVPHLCHTHATNSSSSPNNSPALQSHHTTPPISANDHLTGSDWPNQQQPRPKFWSFYGNEQHSNSLRLGHHQHELGGDSQQQHQQHLGTATLRPSQRKFGLAGRQQPALARNFQCLQQPALQQGALESQQAALEPHQGDYLLAMASVQQLHQQQQQQQAPWQQQAFDQSNNIINNDSELVSSQLERLQFAQLDANELAAANQALLEASRTQQTCAFHAQQQQQQQFQQQAAIASAQATAAAGSMGTLELAQAAPGTAPPTLLPPR